jgi:hypothetical protein
MANKVKTAEEIRAEAIETARIVDDAMRSIASSLQEAFGEAGKEIEDLGKDFAKEANRGLKGLQNNAEALYDANENARKGLYTQNNIQKEIEKKGKAIFLIEAKIAEAIDNGATNGKELNKELAKAKAQSAEFLDSLEKSANKSKEINKAMGLTGAGLKGMKNIAGKLGLSGLETVFEEASNASTKMAEELVNTATASKTTVGLGGKMQTAFEGVKVAASGIGAALMDPLFIIGAIVKSVKFLVGLVSHVRKLTSQVSQTFGIAGKEARNMVHQIESAGVASGDIYHNTQELISAHQELNKQTNLNLDFNEANAKTFRNLSEYMGLGAEKAGALFKISVEMGRPFDSIYKSIRSTTNKLNKSTGDFVQVGAVVDQIANASADTKSSFRGGFEVMVKTARVAARLGTSMEAIKNASRKTLDFQSSIEAEMQAETMLGQNLNLEKLRYATLTRDVGTMAAEQERLVRETMDRALSNQLILDDTAAALGMSTDEYVTMAEAIKANSKLSGKQLKQNQANADAMAEAGKKAQEFDRSLAAALDGFKQSLLPLAEGLEPIFSGVAKTLGLVGKFFASPVGKFVGSLAGLAAGGVLVFKASKSLISMFTGGGGGMFGKRGSSPSNPVFVSGDGGGGSNMGNMSKLLKGNLFKYLGKNGGLSRTLNRTMIKTFGKNGFTRFMQTKVFNPSTLKKTAEGYKVVNRGTTMLGRSMNKLFGKIIPSSGSNLTKAFGTNQMSKIQKMSQTGRYAKGTIVDGVKVGGQFMKASTTTKAGNMVSKFTRGGDLTSKIASKAGDLTSKISSKAGDLTSKIASKASSLLPASATKALTKIGPVLAKTMKAIPIVGAVADLGMGMYTGAGQADLSAEEQRASGVKEGVGKAEAITLGALTGGAEKGSMFTEMVGGEKGSAGDEMLGIGTAAARGAMVGGAVGLALAPFTLGLSVPLAAGIGAVVGTVSEGFKVFSDPNSSLRKGVIEGIDYLGDKTKEFRTALWDTGKDIAKGVGGVVLSLGDFSNKAGAKVAENFSERIDYLGDKTKEFGTALWDTGKDIAKGVGGVASSVGDFANKAGAKIAENFSEGIDYLGDKTKEFGTALWDTGKDIAKGVGGVVSSVGDFANKAGAKIAENFSEGIDYLGDKTKEFGTALWDTGKDIAKGVGGVVSSVGDFSRNIASKVAENFSEGIDYLGDKTKEFGTALWDTGKDIAKGVGGVVSSVGDFSRNIASKVASSLSESSVGKAASSAWEGTKSLASSAGDYVSSWFANGGVAPGGFRAFANGGTVTQPTLGMVGEGRYNEAIIPLPDGKSVPVQMNGGSKGAGNSEVIALLKELITVVKSGGDIYMDGAKVGKTIALATSRMG